MRLSAGLFSLILSVPLFLSAPISAWALDQNLARFTADLRRQQLFPLAETYCQQRLQDENLADDLRIQLTVELARTFTQHASTVSLEDKSSLYERADQILTDYSSKELNELQKLYLHVNQLLMRLTEGEASYWQAELSNTEESRISASETLAKAIEPAIALISSTKDWSSARIFTANATKPTVLNYEELLLLQRDFRLDVARSILRKATLQRELRPDILEPTDLKTNLPELAEDWRTSTELVNVFQKQSEFLDLYFQSHLIEADWELLLGRYEAFESRIIMLRQRSVPPLIETEIVTREARALLQQNKIVEAAKRLHQYQQSGAASTPELEYMTIRSFLELARIAEQKKDPDLRSKLIENIEARLLVIPSGYWAQRAQQLFNQTEQEINYGADLQNLVNQGSELSRSEKPDEAIQVYKKAVELARERDQGPLQAELLYRLGIVQYNVKSYEDAEATFREILTELPESDFHAQAHLMLAYCIGQRGDLSASIKLLREHREKFAESPTLNDATLLLAQLETGAEEYASAMEHYRLLLETTLANDKLLDSLLQVYQQMSRSEQITPEIATKLLHQFREDFPGSLQTVTELNLSHQAKIRLILAELTLKIPPEENSQVQDLLQPLLEKENYDSPAFTPSRSQIGSLYSQYLMSGSFKRQQFDEISDLPISLKLDLFRHLIATPRDEATYHSLKDILERQLQQQKAELPPEDRRDFLTNVLMQKYRDWDTVTSLEELTELELKLELPSSQTREIALMLSETNDPPRQESARQHWKRLESQFEAGGEPWFEARYYQVNLLNKLNRSSKAEKLKRLTLLLHQFPKDSIWKERFQSL
ncbi:Outer membrane protein assembly factor BamD [Polystyrenella longa]|uniref:Outer membrane protein assembly factor BamD n=1 Tax=Polystyrenella longa TaxID=2528007 RepID=A0A518CNZ9_9PLAN|nr:tetratricopeptide repeat protein [Polystyrenella longa]QDU80949.1 Outer membrane protein assembly factor BamD [Polystyrenella longa]